MKIKDIKELEEGTAGFTVQAKVSNVYEITTFKGKIGDFKKQNIKLIDGEDTIYARLSNGFVDNSAVGEDIEISGCILSKWKKVAQIDTNSTSKVKVKRPEKTTETPVRKETVMPPKTLLDTITEATEEVKLVIDHPGMAEIITKGAEIGLTSEDVRAMFISRMIEKSRGR